MRRGSARAAPCHRSGTDYPSKGEPVISHQSPQGRAADAPKYAEPFVPPYRETEYPQACSLFYVVPREISSFVGNLMNNDWKRISEAVKADAAQIGVEVADVRIRRADLPIQVSQAINDRMKTERIREAKGYGADGEKRAQEIRATADKQATITVANAEKEAQKIKGEGDKKATEIWNNATSVDPEFYAFYRTLEAYRNSFDEQTSVVLAPEGEFFNYFGKSLK